MRRCCQVAEGVARAESIEVAERLGFRSSIEAKRLELTSPISCLVALDQPRISDTDRIRNRASWFRSRINFHPQPPAGLRVGDMRDQGQEHGLAGQKRHGFQFT